MSDINMIGATIRARRKATDLSQQELADALGVSQSLVKMYELEHSVVPPRVASHIAGALGIHVAGLYVPELTIEELKSRTQDDANEQALIDKALTGL